MTPRHVKDGLPLGGPTDWRWLYGQDRGSWRIICGQLLTVIMSKC